MNDLSRTPKDAAPVEAQTAAVDKRTFHIPEITEEDESKFDAAFKCGLPEPELDSTSATETSEEQPTPKKKWRLFDCLKCLAFLKLFEEGSRQKEPEEKDILRQIRLIKMQNQTLVLDLDETLVHSTFEPGAYFDFKVKVSVYQLQFELNGKPATSYVRRRFGVEYFLNEMSKVYELVVFTAATKDYAEPVIDALDPKKLIEHRLYRDSCTQVNRLYFKNLSVLNRKLRSTILLDVSIRLMQNSRNSGMLQLENLLLIQSFFDNQKDRELIRLVPFLKHLAGLNDVRPVCKKKIAFDSKEIFIRPTQRQSETVSDSQIDKHSEFGSAEKEKERHREFKRRSLHAKRNSDLQCLVKKEETLSGEETDTKLTVT